MSRAFFLLVLTEKSLCKNYQGAINPEQLDDFVCVYVYVSESESERERERKLITCCSILSKQLDGYCISWNHFASFSQEGLSWFPLLKHQVCILINSLICLFYLNLYAAPVEYLSSLHNCYWNNRNKQSNNVFLSFTENNKWLKIITV